MHREERYLAQSSNISTCNASTKRLLVKLRDQIFREDFRNGKIPSDHPEINEYDDRTYCISRERIYIV